MILSDGKIRYNSFLLLGRGLAFVVDNFVSSSYLGKYPSVTSWVKYKTSPQQELAII